MMNELINEDDTINELQTFKGIRILPSGARGDVVYFPNKKEMMAAFKKKKAVPIGEGELNENPAAIAAAQRTVVMNKAGNKVSVNTARQSSYAEQDPSAHKKAKGMWDKIKDRFGKNENVDAIDAQLKKLRDKKAEKSEEMRQVWAKETGGDHKKSDAIAREVNRLAKEIKKLVARKEKESKNENRADGKKIVGWRFAGKTYKRKADAPVSDPTPIYESKKSNKHILKENYDRFFGDKK